MSLERVALLDVNVLIALFDAAHVHHYVAHDWLADHGYARLATCPITENGFVRIAARLSRPDDEPSVGEYLRLLQTLKRSDVCDFWPDDVSLADALQIGPRDLDDSGRRLRHQELTDIYLLALAIRHDGTLVTCDIRIPITAVANAIPAHVTVLAASGYESGWE